MNHCDGGRRLFGECANRLSGLAASLLGWRPQEFWTSTPAELVAALGPEHENAAQVDRAAIDRLLLQFPDNREN